MGHATARERQGLIDPERLRERLVELVRIPSTGGDEEVAIARLAEWLHGIEGAQVEHWRDEPSALQRLEGYPGHEIHRASVPCVAARLRGARPGPAVMLTGHVDVVPTGDLSTWRHDPYSGLVEGDRIYGRGAGDMKSGVVASLEVMEAFSEAGRDFSGELVFVGVSAEEDGGSGTFSAIQRGWRADAAILPEPTSAHGTPELMVAHAGCLILELRVSGRAAHASTRGRGSSALDNYLVLHEAMREEERRINDGENDPLIAAHERPYATNVGKIRGGSFASSVMDTLTVDVRIGVRLDETVAQAEERFRSVIADAAQTVPWLRDHPPTVTVVTRAFGPGRIATDHPLVGAIADAAETVFGERPAPRAAPYASDMAGWIRQAGVPTVLYGPGDIDSAHGANEWVSLSETVDVARVFASAAERLLETDLPGARGSAGVTPSDSPPPRSGDPG